MKPNCLPFHHLSWTLLDKRSSDTLTYAEITTLILDRYVVWKLNKLHRADTLQINHIDRDVGHVNRRTDL